MSIQYGYVISVGEGGLVVNIENTPISLNSASSPPDLKIGDTVYVAGNSKESGGERVGRSPLDV